MATSRDNETHQHLRRWWLRRQGLTAAARPKSFDACVRTAGWLQTSGSPNLYLSIRARTPGVSRDTIDRAIVDGTTVVEIPGGHARPHVLVPQEEAALALRLHGASWNKQAASYFRSRGNEQAFNAVAAQAARALDEGPLTSVQVRSRVTHPDAPEYLTSALAVLTMRGHARRYPVEGKLDSHAYAYELRHPDDRPDLDAEGDASAVNQRALRLLLQRHGPATVDEMAWWTLLTKAEVRAALAAIDAHAIEVPGWSKQAWLTADDAARWRSFKPDDDDSVVMLPHRDPFVHMRWTPAVLATTPDALVMDLRRGRMLTIPISDIAGGLNHHVVVSGADIVGVWEYDPASTAIQTRLWSSSRTLAKQVADAAKETARCIREQIGDFKLSAADPPDRRKKRIAFCKSR